MAGSTGVGRGHYENTYLIDFVRAASSDGTSWKQQSAPETPSLISGEDAKSFYEQLCGDSNSGQLASKDLPASKHKPTKRKRKDLPASKRKPTKRKRDPKFKVKHAQSDYSGNYGHEKSDVSEVEMTGVRKRRKISTDDRLSKNTVDKASGSGHKSVSSCATKGAKKQERVVPDQRLSQRLVDHRQWELLRLAQHGDRDGVKGVLDKGVDVNGFDQFGWTAAMSAAFEGHSAVVQILLEAGADVTMRNCQGQTAAMLAQQKCHDCVVKLIETYHKTRSLPKPKPKANKKDSASFHCKVCKSDFVESDHDTHNRSLVHMFNLGKKPKDDSFLIPPSNMGYRLMLKTGWDGSKGLGPTGEGQKFLVKTLLKRDREGLGNAAKHKSKVTHFSANDKSAVTSVQSGSGRVANVRTLSKRAQRAKERKARRWEIDIRHQLS